PAPVAKGRALPWVGAGATATVFALSLRPAGRFSRGRHRRGALPWGGEGAARVGHTGQGACGRRGAPSSFPGLTRDLAGPGSSVRRGPIHGPGGCVSAPSRAAKAETTP